MSYIQGFIDEITSRKGLSSLYRESKVCTKCGGKERFSSVCFDEPIEKSETYLKQMSRKHKDCIFDIMMIKKRFDLLKKSEISVILKNSKIENYSSIDVSKFKNYKKRKNKRNNKNIVLFEMFCAECHNVLHRCTFHREKIPESFFRKLK